MPSRRRPAGWPESPGRPEPNRPSTPRKRPGGALHARRGGGLGGGAAGRRQDADPGGGRQVAAPAARPGGPGRADRAHGRQPLAGGAGTVRPGGPDHHGASPASSAGWWCCAGTAAPPRTTRTRPRWTARPAAGRPAGRTRAPPRPSSTRPRCGRNCDGRDRHPEPDVLPRRPARHRHRPGHAARHPPGARRSSRPGRDAGGGPGPGRGRTGGRAQLAAARCAAGDVRRPGGPPRHRPVAGLGPGVPGEGSRATRRSWWPPRGVPGIDLQRRVFLHSYEAEVDPTAARWRRS